MANVTKTQSELIMYLAEHISYEREMLKYASSRLKTAQRLEWCAMFEVFGLHARNMHDFFKNEGNESSTIRACDYVKGFKARDHTQIKQKMNASFFHLSTKRLKNTPVDLNEIKKMGQWIDDRWREWVAQLPEHYLSSVDSEPVCNFGKPNLALGNQPSATNQFSSTTTTTSIAVSFGSTINLDVPDEYGDKI